MNKVNFSAMTMPQLLSFYNRHSVGQPVKRFSDRKAAERRCAELFEKLMIPNDPVKVMRQSVEPAATARPTMQASLKLDRRITCVETSEVWVNAHQMWRAHPDWMTSSQQDRLTAQLYAAAKRGELKEIVINARTFKLLNSGVQK